MTVACRSALLKLICDLGQRRTRPKSIIVNVATRAIIRIRRGYHKEACASRDTWLLIKKFYILAEEPAVWVLIIDLRDYVQEKLVPFSSVDIFHSIQSHYKFLKLFDNDY